MQFRFDWDEAKATSNLLRHGVSFEEASTIFYDELAKVSFDEEHSDGEQRYKIIGMSERGRLLIASFTERGETIRIISARKTTRKERKGYEETGQD
jgi:uncharacterized DUF497 family protein